MEKNKATPATIDAYIAACPAGVRDKLQTLRATIHAAAPQAVEKISYQMPTFHQEGSLVHFALHTNHIGFYPAPSGIEAFQAHLARYAGSKGAVRFPLDEPLPLALVTRIVEYRLAENLAKAAAKRAKKRAG
jgi:uncharacterized protein YdhG (YjbR/CyaY superfamily)